MRRDRYFRRDLDLLGASMMQGGATARSRNTRIIKNAPMFLLSFWRFNLGD
jgi:hypothetical protein